MHFAGENRWRYWYDRSIRSWAVQELDEQANQKEGECEYFARKEHLLISFPDFGFKAEPLHTEFVISMELLRHWISKSKRWKVMGICLQWHSAVIRQYLSDEEWDEYQFLVDSARESL